MSALEGTKESPGQCVLFTGEDQDGSEEATQGAKTGVLTSVLPPHLGVVINISTQSLPAQLELQKT